jgi:CorA-like Mg2+ transporter protein
VGSDRLGKRLRILIVVSAVTLPLGLMAGLLGMNVGGVPGMAVSQGFTSKGKAGLIDRPVRLMNGGPRCHQFEVQGRYDKRRGSFMRWFGIALALAGVVVALLAWFSFQNFPFLIGGIVFMVIGIIIFIKGTCSLPK